MPQLNTRLGPFEVARAALDGPSYPAFGLPEDLVAVLDRQQWAVGAAQLADHGISAAQRRSLIATHRWQTLYPSVYCAYSGPPSDLTLLWAALLHAGPGAVLDGATSATLQGLRGFADEQIHLRVPHRYHPEKVEGLVVKRTRLIAPTSWWERSGLPTFKVERSVLTMATHDPSDAAAVLSAAVQQHLTTAERIRGVLLGLDDC